MNERLIPHAVQTSDAPKAIGPYSQAVRCGDFVFLSGQIPIDPATGDLVKGSIRVQTERVMRNLEAVLKAAGASFADVVRTTIYLTNLGNFQDVNTEYGRFFDSNPPARATVQVSALPKGAEVEIDAVAVLRG